MGGIPFLFLFGLLSSMGIKKSNLFPRQPVKAENTYSYHNQYYFAERPKQTGLLGNGGLVI